jgi:hypothetical protein
MSLVQGNAEVRQRQNALIEINITWLLQALELLGRIDHQAFVDSPRGLEPHRVSSHLRHILEFYECFLDGLEKSHIDYDARRRDESIERSRSAAAGRILTVIERLKAAQQVQGDSIIWVRVEDADTQLLRDPFMTSSVSRELQVLSSHTIHHFALIAMTLRAHGIPVDNDFGMAPSTLRHQARIQAGTAAAEAA